MLFNIVLMIITGGLIAWSSWQFMQYRRQVEEYTQEIVHLTDDLERRDLQLDAQERQYIQSLDELKKVQTEMKAKQKTLEFTNQKMHANEQVLIKAYNQLKESQEEIQYQKKVLEETLDELQLKNSRITDSISYAKKIQQAILPNPLEIQKSFSDAFIIFSPKDVVSGDFYWFSQIENKTFVATVDCTGHGVPGAFMSMIGHTLLNQIVREKKILEPSEILETLDAEIYTSLKQNESKSIDGMDLSLCCVETPMGSTRLKKPGETTKVIFCGAKSNMYYSHLGEIHKIKGNRRALGGWLKRAQRPFTNTVFEIAQGDMIYLITDGYTDAASPGRRHLGTTKLYKFMLKMHSKPLDQQKDFFLTALQNHQKGTEQRDDITFIGFRI